MHNPEHGMRRNCKAHIARCTRVHHEKRTALKAQSGSHFLLGSIIQRIGEDCDEKSLRSIAQEAAGDRPMPLKPASPWHLSMVRSYRSGARGPLRWTSR